MLKFAVDVNKYKDRDPERGKNNYHEEYQYLNLLSDLMEHGLIEEGRNGKALTGFGAAMHFSLEGGKIPLLTTKKTAWKTCLKELLFFVKGETDNNILNQQKVHIWDGNSSPEYMKSVGKSHYVKGDLGPLYGFQWRFFNAPYTSCNEDYTGKGVDQLQNVIDILKDPLQRNSRRLVISAWNPCQIDKAVLPPCHVLFQFNVSGNKLSCTLYQRSNDEFLGVPFNIASYSMLTCLIAKHCDLEPYEFIHFGGNCHIYDDHFEQVKEQISRAPFQFPKLEILKKRDNIKDYVVQDFKIHDYKYHPKIKATMRA
jgi:thymidylate synthase